MSVNHQFVTHGHNTFKKFVKTTNMAVTGFRLDPDRLENRIDWLLASPEDAFDVVWNDGEEVKVIRKKFEYDDEVLELYSELEYNAFKRLNRGLLEHGILVEYSEDVPELDTSNMFTDEQILAIAKTKNLLSLRSRLSGITSIQVINRILEAVEKLDRPMSIARAVQDRKRELTT